MYKSSIVRSTATPSRLVFDLVRDEIPHPSIDIKFEIRPGIGYIHLSAIPGAHGPGDGRRHRQPRQSQGVAA